MIDDIEFKIKYIFRYYDNTSVLIAYLLSM